MEVKKQVVEVVDVDGEMHEVCLDAAMLTVTDETIHDQIQNNGAYYSSYNARWADAIHAQKTCEEDAKALKARKVVEAKARGGAVSMAEHEADADPEVVDMRRRAVDCQRVANYIYGFLKGLDKSHANALSLGYNLRQEWGITRRNSVRTPVVRDANESLDEIMGMSDEEVK